MVKFIAGFKSFFWRWRVLAVATPIVIVIILVVRTLGLLEPLELFAYDRFVCWRSPQPQDQRIVIVGIDEDDVEKIGTALISDELYANLLEKLLQQQPRAIGLDVYRDVPIPPGTEKLNQLFNEHREIIGIEKMIGNKSQYRVKPNPTLKANNQIGFNDVILDEDNRIRRALLALTQEKAFSLSMYTALLYLQQEQINLSVTPDTQYFQLQETVFAPFESNDGGYTNADSGGYQILLNYRGNVNHFEIVSFSDVMENKITPDWAKDKIVLIGFIGESFQDVHLTPYTSDPEERMPGVEIHANIASQILSAAIDHQPLLQTWSQTKENIWIIIWALIGGLITWFFRRSQDFAKGIVLFMIATLVLTAISYLAFLRSWWIPFLPPLIGLIGASASITIYNAYTAAKIRHTFGRFLSTEIVNTLLETPSGVTLGGERRLITILTSDLRGFTAVSEKLAPEEVVNILNFYLGYMANIITEYQGTIDEFMGDGILVLFGAPIMRTDDPDRAVACAIAMQLAMDDVNKQMQAWGYQSLKMGIGINTGEVVVGNIGSEKRTKYGVVGNEVNLTYRIESYTKSREILISESTFNRLHSRVKIAEKRQVSPKGVAKPINIYKIVGIEGKCPQYLPDIQEQTIKLNQSLRFQYSLLNEKDISEQVYDGIADRIMIKGVEKGAYITVVGDRFILPEPLNNLKLRLIDYPESDDLYGKVISVELDKAEFKLSFTYLSLNTEKIITNHNST